MADVTLPSLGESVTEGIITQWFKKVGDLVARDEPLFEVSTDKVDSEMPSPAAGVLVEILAGEGDTVETGARVAVIDESQSVATSSPDAPAPASSASSPTPATPAPARLVNEAPTNGVVVSPVVRRILSDGGVDASSVRGSGPGGSITRRDAERAVALGPTEELVTPLSKGRQRMGAHMSVSSQSVPHGFVVAQFDAPIFERLREQGALTRDGFAVSEEILVTVAAVRALGEFEYLNATFDGDVLTRHRSVNVGLVRALPDDGMLVPVVHAAAGLTVRALARRVHDLDERLATRDLTTDDLMGGTFSVMRSPSAHTVLVAPIIIQPQVAVLSLGSLQHVPVVRRPDGADVIEIGARLALGLSFDHRVCEPVAAAAFLERVGELLTGLDVESEL
ncbi:MAG: 2-oxo acid dehydrogenase subunit E2 [Acidobacteriota bacterium]|nr:2-oxo acid dehydrogenase subunit E2 [Acidobacteriota bacterium]MDE3043437.1 2-oxo acid dehydrogenase subunit E2 [Acidobacteriota bacterium]